GGLAGPELRQIEQAERPQRRHDDHGRHDDRERDHRTGQERRAAGTAATEGGHSKTSRRKMACAETSLRNGRTVWPASASWRPNPNGPAYGPIVAASSTGLPGATLVCCTPPSSAVMKVERLGGSGSVTVGTEGRKALSIAAWYG